MTSLTSRLAALSPEKRALLERRLMAQARRPEDVIVRRPGGEPVPLSFSQQRLWFLDQLDPGAPTYNAVVAMQVEGAVDVGRLTEALDVVIARHEALRTVIRVDGEEPRQVVLEHWKLESETVDLRDLPQQECDGAAGQAIRAAARRAYDLANDLPLRLLALRAADQRWVLAFLEHHIAFDGWSDEVLFAELAELYRASSEGRPPRLPELVVQYGDFSVWQRQRLQGDYLGQQVAYWRQALAGAPPLLQLPSDHARPAVQTFAGVHRFFSRPATTADAIRALATDRSCTAYMVVVAALYAALYRWTGADDVVLGSPFANRERPDLEYLIGFFSNTLPLRVRLDPAAGFSDLLARTRDVVLGAFDHQDLPFELIVDAVAPARDPGYNPLFQVNVRASSAPPALLALPGSTVSPVAVDVGFARFDLALDLTVGTEVGGYVEYNSALFSAERAEELVSGFGRLLDDALRRPEVALWDLAWRDGSGAGIRRGGPVDGRRR